VLILQVYAQTYLRSLSNGIYSLGFSSAAADSLSANNAVTSGSSPGTSPSNHQFRSSPPDKYVESPFLMHFHCVPS
jgi:hypothetical protein